MSNELKKWAWGGAVMCGVAMAMAAGLQAQMEAGDALRKTTHQVMPIYPAAARQWHLKAIVKLHATVAPDGSVKSVTTLGGGPLFVPAAEQAVLQWKYAPSKVQTVEPVVVTFTDAE